MDNNGFQTTDLNMINKVEDTRVKPNLSSDPENASEEKDSNKVSNLLEFLTG
jgi:hypothetical protein